MLISQDLSLPITNLLRKGGFVDVRCTFNYTKDNFIKYLLPVIQISDYKERDEFVFIKIKNPWC